MPLTRKQKWRIDKVQSEKIARADKAALKVESKLHDNDEYPGIVITRYGQRQLIEAENGDLFQSVSRQNIGFSVAGDRVLFQKTKHDEAIVTAIYPRDTELKRQDKIIAANIDQLWLVVAIEPHYEYELIDRYLIMAENSQLPIGIIVNKIELLGKKSEMTSDFSHYTLLGYDVHFLSVKEHINLQAFKEQLINKSHIFLGQSGVGKSSLINELLSRNASKVGPLSKGINKGTHTTTVAQLFNMDMGGSIIDSPGIREFDLWHISPKEVERSFREFSTYIDKCRFRDCRHRAEPNCAIKEAVRTGVISEMRLRSFHSITQQ